VKKEKYPVKAVEDMIVRKSRKMAKFNSEYEEMQEFDKIYLDTSLREIVESGDITGNLGKLW
jgi:hypothetical protein